jgi:hypothetical protein
MSNSRLKSKSGTEQRLRLLRLMVKSLLLLILSQFSSYCEVDVERKMLCGDGGELGLWPEIIKPSESNEWQSGADLFIVNGISGLDLIEEYFVNAEVGDVRNSCGAGEVEETGAS